MGSDRKTRLAAQIYTKLEYSNFYAEFALPFFGGDISGFSNGQILVNIGLSAKIGGEWNTKRLYRNAIDVSVRQAE